MGLPATPQIPNNNPLLVTELSNNPISMDSKSNHHNITNQPYNQDGKPKFNMPVQMSNTKYDIPNNRGTNLITQKDQDAQSVNSKKTSASNYKQYGLKDYNNLKSNIQNQKYGGLGANIGDEKWEMAKRKKEI